MDVVEQGLILLGLIAAVAFFFSFVRFIVARYFGDFYQALYIKSNRIFEKYIRK